MRKKHNPNLQRETSPAPPSTVRFTRKPLKLTDEELEDIRNKLRPHLKNQHICQLYEVLMSN